MSLDDKPGRQVTSEQYKRLNRWAQRKPCVALMGEFSAGKSTLLNFLIEEEVLPTKVTATELPPVWFSFGNEQPYWLDESMQRHPLSLDNLNAAPREARCIRIFIEAEILEHCDIIDTPGISDPNLAVENWRTAAGYANMVLWCTSATQAWRESERAAWLSMPKRLRRNSLLIVTRADKLVSDIDRAKVGRRMDRETEGFFAGRVFMATLRALKAKEKLARGEETQEWETSGGNRLLELLITQFSDISDRRQALMSRYQEGGQGVSMRRPTARIRGTGAPPIMQATTIGEEDTPPARPQMRVVQPEPSFEEEATPQERPRRPEPAEEPAPRARSLSLDSDEVAPRPIRARRPEPEEDEAPRPVRRVSMRPMQEEEPAPEPRRARLIQPEPEPDIDDYDDGYDDGGYEEEAAYEDDQAYEDDYEAEEEPMPLVLGAAMSAEDDYEEEPQPVARRRSMPVEPEPEYDEHDDYEEEPQPVARQRSMAVEPEPEYDDQDDYGYEDDGYEEEVAEPAPRRAAKPKPRMPYEVELWREVIGQYELDPATEQMTILFDEFLQRLYGGAQEAEDGEDYREPDEDTQETLASVQRFL